MKPRREVSVECDAGVTGPRGVVAMTAHRGQSEDAGEPPVGELPVH